MELKKHQNLCDFLAVYSLGNVTAKQRVEQAGFEDEQAACRCLQRIVDKTADARAFMQLLPKLLQALVNTANPDQALIHFESFLNNTIDPEMLLKNMAKEPRFLELLTLLFAGSQFLSEILIRHPAYFEQIKDRKLLTEHKSSEQFYSEAAIALQGSGQYQEKLDILRRFQRRELLRIGAGDLFGVVDLQGVISQLSRLARGMVAQCLSVAAAQLAVDSSGFSVLALGKLGGEELNYSSDIDLLFIAKTRDEVYQRLGRQLIDALTRVTPEGFLYRVDMRLRPWGDSGMLVTAMDDNLTYLRQHARLWEKQAFLKARWIAGDVRVANHFLWEVRSLIFNLPLEASRERDQLRKNVSGMKKQIERHINKNGGEWGEVKNGKGSIRDIEFLTQYLQLLHGGRYPEVRSRATLNALNRLRAAGLLPVNDYRVLVDGYTFLRSVEHHLQMMHNRQIHLLPKDERELNYLAGRLGFQGKRIGKALAERYRQHRKAIRSIFRRYLGKQKKPNPEMIPAETAGNIEITGEAQSHLSRMDVSYQQVFSRQEIQQHIKMCNFLNASRPLELDVVRLEAQRWRITIVAYDYPGELSLICGLLFVYGFNIEDGHIFTYEPTSESLLRNDSTRRFKHRRRYALRSKRTFSSIRKIVDVFTVSTFREVTETDIWMKYSAELSIYLKRLRDREQHEVQGEVAKRVAETLRDTVIANTRLLPVNIEIDNSASKRYTILRIDAADTVGFLYEFVNALALNGIYIARVIIHSFGARIHDTLFVTDAQGKKITDPYKKQELRAAIVLVKQFTHLLPRSPNPESAIRHFRDFVLQVFNQPNWQEELASLKRPEVLDALARLLGVSDFLWDDFLRMQHANLFPVIKDIAGLKVQKSKAVLQDEVNQALKTVQGSLQKQACLNAFKDREMFRIDMRYIQEKNPRFDLFSEALANLAEVIFENAFGLCLAQLQRYYGTPMLENQQICRLSACALGKLGGREIGFASDLELIFIYEGNGHTDGPEVISNAEFYEKLIHEIVRSIHARKEGIFEIDLRLRPYGKAGSLAVLWESFQSYFAPGGPAWNYERQALVKMRPLLGDSAFGERVIRLRDEYVYDCTWFDISAMRAIRERQVRQLVTGGAINAKFSPGGLVDIEYLVQHLQICHARKYPILKQTNTKKAIRALAQVQILTLTDFKQLYRAYAFLRRLIEALRMVRGNARDLTIPVPDSEEYAFLTRRLGYQEDVLQLNEELNKQTVAVREIQEKLLAASN